MAIQSKLFDTSNSYNQIPTRKTYQREELLSKEIAEDLNTYKNFGVFHTRADVVVPSFDKDGEEIPAEYDNHYEERLVCLLDGVRLLSDGNGDSGQPDRSAAKLGADGLEDFDVHLVQPVRIDFEKAERLHGNWASYHVARLHLRVVAHAPEEIVGYARSASRARGNFQRALAVDADTQLRGRARHDLRQFRRFIETKTIDQPKRARSGAAIKPIRVVAPTRVNRGSSRRTLRAFGPWSIMMSIAKSSMAE